MKDGALLHRYERGGVDTLARPRAGCGCEHIVMRCQGGLTGGAQAFSAPCISFFLSAIFFLYLLELGSSLPCPFALFLFNVRCNKRRACMSC